MPTPDSLLFLPYSNFPIVTLILVSRFMPTKLWTRFCRPNKLDHSLKAQVTTTNLEPLRLAQYQRYTLHNTSIELPTCGLPHAQSFHGIAPLLRHTPASRHIPLSTNIRVWDGWIAVSEYGLIWSRFPNRLLSDAFGLPDTEPDTSSQELCFR